MSDCPHTWTGTHPDSACINCGLKLGDYWLVPDEEPEENDE